MDPQFEQRLRQVATERNVHLCDRVMRWYTPLILGGVMALCVGFSADQKTTKYVMGGTGAAAVAAGLGTAAYGLNKRLQAPQHIKHYEDHDHPGDVVPIDRPVRYRPL